MTENNESNKKELKIYNLDIFIPLMLIFIVIVIITIYVLCKEAKKNKSNDESQHKLIKLQ